MYMLASGMVEKERLMSNALIMALYNLADTMFGISAFLVFANWFGFLNNEKIGWGDIVFLLVFTTIFFSVMMYYKKGIT